LVWEWEMHLSQLKNRNLRSDNMLDQHIADCEKEGKPAEKSYKGVFNVRISPKLHKKASHAAIKKGITLNQMIKLALEKELEDH